MKPKHILFLSSWYPSRLRPFAGDFVQRHAWAASRLNQISVLHAAKQENLGQVYEVDVKEGIIKEVVVYYKHSWFRPLNYIRRLIALKKGLKHIEDFHLVHLNVTYPAGVFAPYLKFFKNKKYVITEHWTGFRKDLFRQINFLERILIKFILKNSEKLLPVSQDLGKSMQSVSGNKPFEVIPNVIDTDLFVPDLNLYEKKICRFLHLSNLKSDHKNILGMLNVAKRLADEQFQFEFHIGGNGSLKEIEKFIADNHLELQIQVFGTLQYNEVPAKMNAYDCFVLFSNYENQPCVQTESYSCGVPFIGSDVGGIPEFLPEGFGIIVRKGNEDDLYEAMKEVINGKKFASKEAMHQYARDHFSYETIARRFDEVYKKVLNES
ncbi:MAG: glycosyltransferase [Moheibacter sp.]